MPTHLARHSSGPQYASVLLLCLSFVRVYELLLSLTLTNYSSCSSLSLLCFVVAFVVVVVVVHVVVVIGLAVL